MPQCNRLRMEYLERVKGFITNHAYGLVFHLGQQLAVNTWENKRHSKWALSTVLRTSQLLEQLLACAFSCFSKKNLYFRWKSVHYVKDDKHICIIWRYYNRSTVNI